MWASQENQSRKHKNIENAPTSWPHPPPRPHSFTLKMYLKHSL